MAATTHPSPDPGAGPDVPPGGPGAPERLARFDVAERALHWVSATLFGVLILTAVPLYVGSVADLVGRRELIARVHLWAGLALPAPLLLAVAGPWGAALRRDLRRVNRWSEGEMAWLRSLGRDPFTRLGKFNPGQKLNAAFTGGVIAVMLASGAVMQWNRPFPDGWRTGATFVHDVVATAFVIVVVGHVAFAVTHRDALRSMVRGWVSAVWARRHAPAWLDEVEAGEP